MSPRDYRRIFASLSPVEREMLRDIDNGTVYGRSEHVSSAVGMSPLYDASRIKRLKRLAKQFKDAADSVVIHSAPVRRAQAMDNPTPVKINSAKRARRVKVAA